MNKSNLLLFLIFFSCFTSITLAQDVYTLEGKITSVIDSIPLNKASVINLNTIDGSITNDKGVYNVMASVNDTIMVSYLGFQSVKIKVTKDLTKAEELNISLFPKAEELEPVVLGYKLIGVLEIDMKSVPKGKFNRISIKGLPQTYEVGKSTPRSGSLGILKAIFNPVDYVYNLFGKKPNKLKKLKELKETDKTREILAQRFDREIILDYLQTDINKLTEILRECNYSNFFIQKATDLQLIEAVLECYEKDSAIKKGATSNSR